MFDWYLWAGLPLLVFFARLVDVSLGTLRIIFTSRGMKKIAPLLGFIEVFIWVSVIAEITKGAHNVIAYLAYAGGFAAGNYVGMYIEDKLAMGMLVIRAIVPEHVTDLIKKLQEKGFGFTVVNALGSQGPVKLVYTVIQRKNLPEVAITIREAYPKAFFTVEELRSAEQGIFPPAHTSKHQDTFPGRKSK
jgi:uncharacterized protein YebE (UPF0316 family)